MSIFVCLVPMVTLTATQCFPIQAQALPRSTRNPHNSPTRSWTQSLHQGHLLAPDQCWYPKQPGSSQPDTTQDIKNGRQQHNHPAHRPFPQRLNHRREHHNRPEPPEHPGHEFQRGRARLGRCHQGLPLAAQVEV
ncbi:hypothetical protein QBC39DRAFT_106727 [Podospora conica]|nr:hypothetical protein QBC39DRAFT_106727 [Schizothecium conicum]